MDLRTRRELFIAALTDSSIVLPEPYTRAECYLAKANGKNVSIPTPRTREEMYLACLAGADVVPPVPLDSVRLEKFLYAACGYTITLPVPMTYEEALWEEYINSAPEDVTVDADPATGIATITNGSAGAAKSLRVTGITPVQNLNGYSKPWAGGAGSNLFDASAVADENKYVIVTSGFTTAPSASSNAVWRYTDFIPVTPGDVLYFGEKGAAASAAGTAFYSAATQGSFISGSGFSATQLGSANNVWTVPEGAAYMRHSFRIDEGYNEDWETSVFIIRNSDTHEWFPYANICPITGCTELNITVSPTMDAKDGTTYTATLGSTLYGGSVDVTAGIVTETYGEIASYNGETLPGAWLSDRDQYAAGMTPTTGAQVVYELASSVSGTADPTVVSLLDGTNYVWSDVGLVHVTYTPKE